MLVNKPHSSSLRRLRTRSGGFRSPAISHPILKRDTEPQWRDHRDDLPAVHDGLAAVHCRQRHLREIVAALARQLTALVPTPDPKVLVKALKDAAIIPPVVLDALDESTDPAGVLTRLNLPLAEVAWVVVGVRPWAEFQPLRDQATALLDVDDVPEADCVRTLPRTLTTCCGPV